MPNKMLIDATHPEETRVVVVRGNRVEEFDFESAQRKQLRGNIYLAKVTRVEPSLQAAFIEYGGNRHGFLAFSEIHPDYYQIPVADRQALIEAEEQAHREAEEENDNRATRRRSRHRNSRRRNHGERVRSEIVEGAPPTETPAGEQAEPYFPHGSDVPQPYMSYGYDDEPSENADGASKPAAVLGDERVGADVPPRPIEVDYGDQGDEGIDDPFLDPIPVSSEQPAPTGPDDESGSKSTLAHDAEEHVSEHHADDATHEHDHHDAEDDDDDDDTEEEEVESVGGDDVMEEVPERSFRPRRQYKIQEVIKRRQVMLVQVVKEERGNKGAALTTYLSLAGRYAVLMPNTARGGGISRKITSAQDRNRLKDVVQDLDVPEGMGIILRTAGASRTKPEIKRDFEYLLRMWETVRDLTLKSQAPTLVYEEGSLIKRSLRDLYNKEIDDVMVAGEGGYQEARDFMKMLMPTNVRAVKQYRDGQPLFSRMGVESQLDAMFSPTVTLRSGGYIVINQTEALVSIDVNSGRSTREHHIEDTALKTNLEAAEEVARQLRLRDLAGLIVIDFIDMDEKRNNRAVERKMSDCLRQDRARIQVGRISHFGLLEMSRQRIRASVLESSTEPCPTCGGTGHVRSVASVALQLLRGLEEQLMKGATHNMTVRTRTDVALYVLNHKRGHLRDLEEAFQVTLSVIADPTVNGQQSFIIDRGEPVHTLEAAKAILAARSAAQPIEEDEDEEEDEILESESGLESDDVEAQEADGEVRAEGEEGQNPRRRRRRRRRGRGGAEGREQPQPQEDSVSVAASDETAGADEDSGEDEADETGEAFAENPRDEQRERRPRRRGRRGGRRRRGGQENGAAAEDGLVASIADDFGPTESPEITEAVADLDTSPAPAPTVADHAAERAPVVTALEETAQTEDKPAPRRSTVREKVSLFFGDSTASTNGTPPVEAPEPEVPTATVPEPEVPNEQAASAPRRMGWWSRRSE